ncbi:hypothetical protein COCSADRAFT_99361 [Bipolaris sorokiniana ND90Pr]|uniref:Uncharacterized protein n=1 Tax=Cochliobolus sativus (strain ND90Pr / ATCC 201652) TaxID=665912 RepID=M2RZ35_COCSN|nr:uncharacterized protein COCSADRAFT_99361 [Bipolaris sorokiniana ND90Pr]EMD60293.1 hypothetical protein COCSADRAFT_99361 [Bipolaris sorokiniana ND90Pr]
MKFVTIITAIMSVAAATAISAELQERQCIPNGSVPCGSNNDVCQPITTGCKQKSSGSS